MRRAVVVIELGDRDVELARCSFAPDLHGASAARFDAGDRARQVPAGRDRLAVEFQDDVTRFDASFRRRTVGIDGRHQRAGRLAQTEGFGQFLGDFLDDHADTAARHFAVALELLSDVHGDVDRDGKRQTHKAAGAAVDLRIDADYFALHVEQRSTRVSWVDGHVSLDEGDEILLRQ